MSCSAVVEMPPDLPESRLKAVVKPGATDSASACQPVESSAELVSSLSSLGSFVSAVSMDHLASGPGNPEPAREPAEAVGPHVLAARRAAAHDPALGWFEGALAARRQDAARMLQSLTRAEIQVPRPGPLPACVAAALPFRSTPAPGPREAHGPEAAGAPRDADPLAEGSPERMALQHFAEGHLFFGIIEGTAPAATAHFYQRLQKLGQRFVSQQDSLPDRCALALDMGCHRDGTVPSALGPALDTLYPEAVTCQAPEAGPDALVPGLWYREWIPNGRCAFLFGDFSDWRRADFPMLRDQDGVHHVFIPHGPAGPAIPHQSRYKVGFRTRNTGAWLERAPAWAKYLLAGGGDGKLFDAIHWSPERPYRPRFARPAPLPPGQRLLIYEAHVGIASPEPRIASYMEFAERVVPRIAALGYNAIQVMAVQHHPYYASFGYHVTHPFAVSGYSGTPCEFRALVDKCHQFGLRVILDIVQAHGCSNVLDGLGEFDGTPDGTYFHGGPRGTHSQWDSRIFAYERPQVARYLLSNLRFWLDCYGVDGFRFDGITSMLYTHHGIFHVFSGDYREYFDPITTDRDAIAYLTLANALVADTHPGAITVAEDVSGMPLLARPLAEAGMGFGWRMAMFPADEWTRLAKEIRDEDWSVSNISWMLSNRRHMENTVVYVESHDQCLVGDQALMFRMAGASMYSAMSRLSPPGPDKGAVERALRLHKMIRLVTLTLGGEGYLNFIGNEFGHPEWLDFPREGNGNSYNHARRQFQLLDDPNLHFGALWRFDAGLIWGLGRVVPRTTREFVSRKNDGDQVLAFDFSFPAPANPNVRLDATLADAPPAYDHYVVVANFHPYKSFEGYSIGVPAAGTYRMVLSSEAPIFSDRDTECYRRSCSAPQLSHSQLVAATQSDRGDDSAADIPTPGSCVNRFHALCFQLARAGCASKEHTRAGGEPAATAFLTKQLLEVASGRECATCRADSLIDPNGRYFSDREAEGGWDGRAARIQVYIPSRTALVLKRE
ncbi:hypothetical protein H696_00160 [Fonticula alba]|uniref:1,4-alpha-glucan branching enzyme n=1 Tax=Fonticula alba TaxID=691883 RepID=A0A058ZDY1_FONAL|nr:hypothetical protein H696_00160 [Fonticula alba]KCV72569.1 hypothetical protein H696_00160 [Fonticula alba]|eukprot:XP_009492270.1 hypothetical protein H696_00160 [Fonticula alba]